MGGLGETLRKTSELFVLSPYIDILAPTHLLTHKFQNARKQHARSTSEIFMLQGRKYTTSKWSLRGRTPPATLHLTVSFPLQAGEEGGREPHETIKVKNASLFSMHGGRGSVIALESATLQLVCLGSYI